MNQNFFKKSKGVTLIELLIALVISAILIAGIYRTFIHQQRTYATQEQVADMQQNVRVAINRMVREIRMSGFGGKNENTNGNNDIINIFGNVNGFTNIINPENNVVEDGITHDRVTVVAAYDQIATVDEDVTPLDVTSGKNTLKITYTGDTKFDKDVRKYMCINGRNNYEIVPAAGNTITLAGIATLNETHSAGEPVFLIRAIRYGLRVVIVDGNEVPVLFRDLYPNTGSSRRESVAENIEDLRFRYVLADTTEVDVPGNPRDIRGVRITIQARTRMSDPELKEGGGFRRRTLNTYVDLRNQRD
jgi:prepilin-type N-terminal cleavage/methylation domain-containing protein